MLAAQSARTQIMSQKCKLNLIIFLTSDIRFFTPYKDGFVEELRLKAGLDQKCSVSFNLNYIVGYELTKTSGGYYPLIISINY